jgi:NADPH-dependent 7-cyano-7-deazaguanine reductase QueF
MSSFLNKMGITGIVYEDNVNCFCPIGESTCTYQLKIEFEPDKVIPDYIEMHKAITCLSNAHLTMEDAVATVFDIVVAQCSPKRLRVTNKCEDARHPVAIVTKEMS